MDPLGNTARFNAPVGPIGPVLRDGSVPKPVKHTAGDIRLIECLGSRV